MTSAGDLLPDPEEDELTIAGAAELCRIPVDELTRQVRRGRVPSRLAKGPRRGLRVIRRAVLEERGMIAEPMEEAVLDIAGMRVRKASDSLAFHEVAVLLDGASVTQVGAMVTSGELPAAGSNRVPVAALLDRFTRAGDQWALVLLARVVSGELTVRPPLENEDAGEGHVEALRRLL